MDSPRSVNQSSRKALADAIAGVVGALVSMVVVYPLDRYKTNIQASTQETDDVRSVHSLHRALSTISIVSTSQLYAGIGMKSFHTLASNFCYFYLHSWIVSLWTNRHPSPTVMMSTSTSFLLSTLAACLNTFLTLPIDVVSAIHQTSPISIIEEQNGTDAEKSKRQQEGLLLQFNNKDEGQDNGLLSEVSCDEEQYEKPHDFILTQDETCSHQLLQLPTVFEVIWCQFQHTTMFWRGLWPSLILCLNPAINYTLFDLVKQKVVLYRRRGLFNSDLTLVEAFVLGWIAKLVATMVTYPLIRAKVQLMVMSCGKKRTTLITCLVQDYRRGHLFRGCELQLLHTLFKSAIQMMVREQLGQAIQRQLGVYR